MTKKNRKGRVCFILLNCILLLLGVCMLISTIYVMNDTTFIPVAKELPSVWEIAILASIALVILSVFGFGASCGGCTLYFYLMITLLLNILLFAGSIAAFLVFFALKTPTSENGIAHLVNTTIARWVEDPYAATDWKRIQDSMKCCGYYEHQQTGFSCLSTLYTDCSGGIFELITKGSLFGGIGVAVMVLVLLAMNCVTCRMLKTESGRQRE